MVLWLSLSTLEEKLAGELLHRPGERPLSMEEMAAQLNLLSLADEDMPQVVLEEEVASYALEDDSKGQGGNAAYEILYTG